MNTEFEERLADLIGGLGPVEHTPPVAAVLAGARRRRTRRRVAVTGASLAMVGALVGGSTLVHGAWAGGGQGPAVGRADPTPMPVNMMHVPVAMWAKALPDAVQIGSGTAEGYRWAVRAVVLDSANTFWKEHPELFPGATGLPGGQALAYVASVDDQDVYADIGPYMPGVPGFQQISAFAVTTGQTSVAGGTVVFFGGVLPTVDHVDLAYPGGHTVTVKTALVHGAGVLAIPMNHSATSLTFVDAAGRKLGTQQWLGGPDQPAPTGRGH